jgi:hypothetical protein
MWPSRPRIMASSDRNRRLSDTSRYPAYIGCSSTSGSMRFLVRTTSTSLSCNSSSCHFWGPFDSIRFLLSPCLDLLTQYPIYHAINPMPKAPYQVTLIECTPYPRELIPSLQQRRQPEPASRSQSQALPRQHSNPPDSTSPRSFIQLLLFLLLLRLRLLLLVQLLGRPCQQTHRRQTVALHPTYRTLYLQPWLPRPCSLARTV